MKRLVFFVILATLVASTAYAELRSARAPLAYAGGDTARIQVSADRAQELPSAFLIWTGDATPFWMNTYLTATTISTPLKIPQGQPITIPAPPPYSAYGKWWVRILTYSPTCTDSVYAIPLDR